MSWQHGDTPPHGFLVQPRPTKVCPNCSVQTQTLAHFCPACGTSYTRQPPPPPAAAVPRNMPRWMISVLVGGVILLGLGWASGSFDPWLSQYGLNKNSCLENYFTGNVVCGDKARDYCRQLGTAHIQPDACKEL